MTTRAVIVEDHPLVRIGLRKSLERASIEVVGEAEDGVDGAALVEDARPDIAIVDLGLPGKDGIALTRELKQRQYCPRIIILTMKEEDTQVLASLTAGADGYCVKSSGQDVFLDAVRTVAAGGAFFDPRVAHVVLRRLRGLAPEGETSPLSPRETEILRLIAEGMGNVEIAARLSISLSTVKTHVAEIMRKLAASDRAHAAVIALRGGFLN